MMNRFNPYEWGTRYNLGRAEENEAQSFNITGSLWFTFTTLQKQGTYIITCIVIAKKNSIISLSLFIMTRV